MRALLLGLFLLQASLMAQALKPVTFDTYLQGFDYQARKDMKIKSKEMLKLVAQGKAQLVDIRFREEYEAWHLAGSINIPLNELPSRLNELDRSKLIITACPHNDRANMGRMFLQLKGYNVKYLSDGLLTAIEQLRGDNAKTYIENLNKGK